MEEQWKLAQEEEKNHSPEFIIHGGSDKPTL
jgi:hypothetical protein